MIQWMTAKEAAKHLKINPRTLTEWARKKKIPAHPISGNQRVTWRFLLDEIDSDILARSSADPLRGGSK